MSSKTKEKQSITEDKVGEFPLPENNGKMALIPPASLIVSVASEAEQAFLAEAPESSSVGPTKLPTITVNHKGADDGSFIMPDGSEIDGAEGICGFIIAHFTTRTYYAKPYDSKGEKIPPDCRSSNSIVPDNDVPDKQSPDCASCPHNQFGTAKVGKGKACKEYIRLFIVNPEFGNPPIAMITLPPTAIQRFYGSNMIVGGKRGYVDQLQARSVAWQIIWSRITLKREDENDAHVTPCFEMGQTATLEVAKALAALNNQFITHIKASRKEDVHLSGEGE